MVRADVSMCKECVWLEVQLVFLHHRDYHLFDQMFYLAVAEYVNMVADDTPGLFYQKKKKPCHVKIVNYSTLTE